MRTYERRRFTTKAYSAKLGGYAVFDRTALIAVFVEQGLAVKFCKLLRLFPEMMNSDRNLTTDELAEIER